MNTDIPQDIEQELLTATSAGNPVKKRIKNAASAFSIFDRLRVDNENLAKMRALIKRQFDGNAPIDQSRLNEAAQGWRSNVNLHQSKAIIDAAAATQWSMVMSTPTIATFSCLIPTGERNKDYGAVLSKVFTKMVREEWKAFSYQLMLRIKESLLYGNGAMFFRDEWDWKSEAINAARIMVPRNTRSMEGGVEFCLIRDEISPLFLANLIENSKYASKEGWNIGVIKDTLKQKYFDKGTPNRDSDEYRLSQWESAEQRNKNLSWTMPATAEFEPVACVHLLVEELDGEGVSHYILFEDCQTRDQYMFEAEKQYKSMNNAVHFLLFGIGDGFYRSVRGLATDIYSTVDCQMRLTNSMIDGAVLSSGLLLQAQTAVSADKMRVIKKGPLTILPPDLQALQSTFQPPLDSILAVRNEIDKIQNQVVGLYKNESGDSKVARTAREVEIQQENEQRFSSTQNAWFYAQFERWLSETFRRLINPDYPKSAPGYAEHITFIVRCVAEGVPPELMLQPGAWELHATRNIGYGSPSRRESVTRDLISIISMLDEAGRQAAIQEYVAARVPFESVSRFVADVNRNELPSLQLQMAEGESADMAEGTPRTVTSEDWQLVHVQEHAQFLNGIIDGALQGQKDPIETSQILPVFLQHLQTHLQYMSQDQSRKADMQQAEQIIKQLMEKAGPIQQQAEEIQKQQQKQAEENQKKLEDAEEVLRNKEFEIEKYKADKNAEIELYKADQLDKSRQTKTNTSAQAMITKLQATMEANQTKMQSDIELNAAKTRADIESKLQKAMADIQVRLSKAGGKSSE